MKAWIQRVTEASVAINGESVSRIEKGYLILLGVTHSDTEKTADEMADRICKLRICEDENGKTNKSIVDTGGSVIVVSQFTLYADTSHGRRPGFSNAARPELAEPLYGRVVEKIRGILGKGRVGTGRFGAEMKVHLVNDGPFSVELVVG
ncbi:MAG: D-tyrosyl-tRNA(Tyr) deacylase [Kiritimatiellae bacterium]|nr:D-tyrosyl-tRNA(Tyr) deacylase [Kiritimatiellia bacterium]